MSLKRFIDDVSSRYDRDSLVNDVFDNQKKYMVIDSLAEWSDIWPILNGIGYFLVSSGSRYGVFPLDFLKAKYEQLYNAAMQNSDEQIEGLIAPTVYSIGRNFNWLIDSFGSQLAATMFPPGYDQSYSELEIPTTITTRGRRAIDLGSNATSSAAILVRYKALHEIKDKGKLLTINTLPANNDPLSINGVAYTFKTTADPGDPLEIEIQDNVYSMSETLSDALYTPNEDQTSAQSLLSVESTPDGATVQLRPYTLGANITVVSDGVHITSSVLPAINTVPADEVRHIANLVLSKLALARAGQVARGAERASSKVFTATFYQDRADYYFKLVKPYLHKAR